MSKARGWGECNEIIQQIKFYCDIFIYFKLGYSFIISCIFFSVSLDNSLETWDTKIGNDVQTIIQINIKKIITYLL